MKKEAMKKNRLRQKANKQRKRSSPPSSRSNITKSSSISRMTPSEKLYWEMFPDPNAKNRPLFRNIPALHPGISFSDPNTEKFLSYMTVREDAQLVREGYKRGPDNDKMTCIWTGGEPFDWEEKSYGVSWIGVTAMDATCVVAMKEKKSPRSGCVQDVLIMVLADMLGGDYADKSTVFHQKMLSLSPKKLQPFAVVSAAPGFVEDKNGLQGQQDRLAVNFLEKTLKYHSVTSEEITQIAICALKIMLGANFKSDRIEIKGSGNWSGVLGRMNAGEVDGHLADGAKLIAILDSLGSSSP